MELGLTFSTLILVLVLLYIFKKPVKTVTGYINDNLHAEVNEGQVDLIQRSMNAYQEVIDTCGENFLTPREVHDLLHKREKKSKNNATA